MSLLTYLIKQVTTISQQSKKQMKEQTKQCLVFISLKCFQEHVIILFYTYSKKVLIVIKNCYSIATTYIHGYYIFYQGLITVRLSIICAGYITYSVVQYIVPC